LEDPVLLEEEVRLITEVLLVMAAAVLSMTMNGARGDVHIVSCGELRSGLSGMGLEVLE
jgi:hypothetical protein